MFDRVDALLADLATFATDPAAVMVPFSFTSNETGAALLQLAAGRTPASIESVAPGRTTFDSAQRFLADIVFSAKNNYFTLLCIERDAPDELLRENYRRLIALVHPDARPIGFPSDAAARVNLGYAVLSNPAARASYADALDRLPSSPVAAPSGNDHRNQGPTGGGLRPRSRAGLGSPLRWFRRPRFGVGLLALATILILPVLVVMTDLAKDTQGERLVSGRSPVASGQLPTAVPSELAATSQKRAIKVADAASQPAKADVAATPARAGSISFANAAPPRELAVATLPFDSGNMTRLDAADASARALSNGEPQTSTLNRPSEPKPSIRLPMAPVPGRMLAAPDMDALRVESLSASAPVQRRTAPTPTELIAPASTALISTSPVSPGDGNSTAPSPGPVQSASATGLRISQARTRDSEDVLLRFGSAYEQGSIDGVRKLFAAAMPGRVQMIADYQRVFASTQQRSIRFLQLKHTVATERVTTVGQAIVSTVSPDNKKSSQRVFLEIEVARDGNEVRIERMSNYALD